MRRNGTRTLWIVGALAVMGCGSSSPPGTLDASSGNDAPSSDATATPDGSTAADATALPDAMGLPDATALPDAPPPRDATPVSDAPQPVDAAVRCTTVRRTCAQIRASFAAASTMVSVTCDETAGTFTIRSTGAPDYTSNQTTPNAIRDQGWVVTLPLNPTCAPTPTDAIASRGAVGFMINGVPFYGPQDAEGRDALMFEGPSFDDCVGHADMQCSYHYHVEPVCVFGLRDTAARHAEADGHPAVIGYALDGFAIHASYETGATGSSLDACNGHSDATHGYHYHATRTSPYLVGCLAGTRTTPTRTMALCTGGGGDGGVMMGDAAMPPPDGAMPPADGGTMTPRTCTTAAQCAGACPAGSAGCTCANSPMGMICVPSCTTSTDCPRNAMGVQLTCEPTMRICVPPR